MQRSSNMQQPFIGNRDYRQESFQVLFSKKIFFCEERAWNFTGNM